ncbi:MAG: TraB/GumN family protein [Desulfofustis sp.]|nr:TraB/GumN family protein [Desulfofustis sp.]
MNDEVFPGSTYCSDVHLLQDGERTVLLVGTAHVSQQSVDLVTSVISTEHPDAVCLELDERRFQALTDKLRWQSLDLKTIIKSKQLSTLLVSLLMASYQRRLGDQLGVIPGAELLAAAKAAEHTDASVFLCDRDIRITMRRAWKSTSFFRKLYLLSSLLASLFDTEKIDEKKLEELKNHDSLGELMAELGDALPELKRVLIDERDIYLAEKIKETPGSRIVAVVGAGHVPGIKRCWPQNLKDRMEDINGIPPVSPAWKLIGWLIPILILSAIGLIGYRHGAQAAGENIVYWILANGIPSAIGALLALAHPATTLSAFVAAPLTSLTPVIGAGYVTAFVQVMTRPPVVREFETVATDMASLFGWWRNKLLRVFLVFLLTGLGSAIGTYIGGYEIIKNLAG